MFGLGQDILSNIIAAIILGILGWFLSILLRLPFVYRKRRLLFQFFGITKENPNLTVYLSTVFVQNGGSVDFRGVPRTFTGPAIPSAELSTIEPLSRLFNDPLLDGLPKPLREWLSEKVHWSFQSISPVFTSSPQDRNHVAHTNIFTVGSQYYNSAADIFTETCNPILKMVQVGQRTIVRVSRGAREGDTFEQRPQQSDDLAIVEKIFDEANNRFVFFAAGLGVIGTIGAVHFTAKNWSKLMDDFDTKPFAICLRFQDVLNDPHAYKKPVELSRFQIA